MLNRRVMNFRDLREVLSCAEERLLRHVTILPQTRTPTVYTHTHTHSHKCGYMKCVNTLARSFSTLQWEDSSSRQYIKGRDETGWRYSFMGRELVPFSLKTKRRIETGSRFDLNGKLKERNGTGPGSDWNKKAGESGTVAGKQDDNPAPISLESLLWTFANYWNEKDDGQIGEKWIVCLNSPSGGGGEGVLQEVCDPARPLGPRAPSCGKSPTGVHTSKDKLVVWND